MKTLTMAAYFLVSIGVFLQLHTTEAPTRMKVMSSILWPVLLGLVIADSTDTIRYKNYGKKPKEQP